MAGPFSFFEKGPDYHQRNITGRLLLTILFSTWSSYGYYATEIQGAVLVDQGWKPIRAPRSREGDTGPSPTEGEGPGTRPV